MKKIGLIFVTILVAVLAWKYFSRVSPISITENTIEEKPQPVAVLEQKPPLVEIEQPKIIIKKEAVPVDEVEQKTAKALQYIQKKSRLPTGALKVNPEILVSHESLSGTRWKIWPGVRAVRSEDLLSNDVVVAELSRFNLVESSTSESALNDYDRNSPVVVYETRLKRPGVVTGLIKIETDKKELLTEALQRMNAQIENSFDQIQTYYVSSQQTKFDLEKLYLNLKSLPFVKNIELDILDRNYEKK